MRARSLLVLVSTFGVALGAAAGAASSVAPAAALPVSGPAAPVVVDSLTTATRLVTRDPASGRMTAQLSALPVRQQDPDGVWRPVDATLEVRDGRVVPRRVPTQMSFSAGGAGELAAMVDQDRQVGLGWPEWLPAPVLSGSTATYPEVWPGVDLTVQASVTGYSTHLVVKTPAAAKDPRVRDFSFTTRAQGLTLRPTAAGGAEGVDAAGRVEFSSPRPRMWDSAGVPSPQATQTLAGRAGVGPRWGEHGGSKSRSMRATLAPSRLRVQADTTLLDDPGAVFPIVLDPSVPRTRGYTYWAMVWSDGQYFINDAVQNARVGYDGWSGQGKVSRSFFNFDTAGLYGTQVTKAVLRHNQVHSPQEQCDVAHYGSAIQAGVTWGIGTGTRWPGPGFITMGGANDYGHGSSGSCPGADTVEWDMTAAISKHAAAASAPVLTVGLKGVNEADKYGWRQYDNTPGSMPSLYVEYNSYPWQPSQSQLRVDGSASGVSTTTTPMLSALFGDPDRATIQQAFKGRFYLYGANNVKVWEQDTAWLPGAPATTAVGSVRVPAGLLQDGATYTMKVLTVDQNLLGSATSQMNFTVDVSRPTAAVDSVAAADGAAVVDKGQPVTIVGHSPSNDVTQLCVTFRGQSLPCKPATTNQPVTFEVPGAMVNEIGPAAVTIVAKDRTGIAGQVGDGASIRVRSLAAGVKWYLNDTTWPSVYVPQSSAVPGNALAADPGVLVVDGRPGGALEGNKAVHASTLRYGPSAVVDTSTSFTAMALVRPTSEIASGTDTSVQVALSQETAQTGSQTPVFELGAQAGYPVFRVRIGNTVTQAVSTRGWNAGMDEWVKLAGVYDAAKQQIVLYVDGQPGDPIQVGGAPQAGTGLIRVGRSSTSTGAEAARWLGDVDAVALFFSALSPVEINAELENQN